ncbi:hypothetical protein OF83DRAFT_1086664 [Amylostereum chailletii]|nr:hypothetical protein OF83DRAFT_1086664 [Amylostereum chailletii]
MLRVQSTAPHIEGYTGHTGLPDLAKMSQFIDPETNQLRYPLPPIAQETDAAFDRPENLAEAHVEMEGRYDHHPPRSAHDETAGKRSFALDSHASRASTDPAYYNRRQSMSHMGGQLTSKGPPRSALSDIKHEPRMNGQPYDPVHLGQSTRVVPLDLGDLRTTPATISKANTCRTTIIKYELLESWPDCFPKFPKCGRRGDRGEERIQAYPPEYFRMTEGPLDLSGSREGRHGMSDRNQHLSNSPTFRYRLDSHTPNDDQVEGNQCLAYHKASPRNGPTEATYAEADTSMTFEPRDRGVRDNRANHTRRTFQTDLRHHPYRQPTPIEHRDTASRAQLSPSTRPSPRMQADRYHDPIAARREDFPVPGTRQPQPTAIPPSTLEPSGGRCPPSQAGPAEVTGEVLHIPGLKKEVEGLADACEHLFQLFKPGKFGDGDAHTTMDDINNLQEHDPGIRLVTSPPAYPSSALSVARSSIATRKQESASTPSRYLACHDRARGGVLTRGGQVRLPPAADKLRENKSGAGLEVHIKKMWVELNEDFEKATDTRMSALRYELYDQMKKCRSIPLGMTAKLFTPHCRPGIVCVVLTRPRARILQFLAEKRMQEAKAGALEEDEETRDERRIASPRQDGRPAQKGPSAAWKPAASRSKLEKLPECYHTNEPFGIDEEGSWKEVVQYIVHRNDGLSKQVVQVPEDDKDIGRELEHAKKAPSLTSTGIQTPFPARTWKGRFLSAALFAFLDGCKITSCATFTPSLSVAAAPQVKWTPILLSSFDSHGQAFFPPRSDDAKSTRAGKLCENTARHDWRGERTHGRSSPFEERPTGQSSSNSTWPYASPDYRKSVVMMGRAVTARALSLPSTQGCRALKMCKLSNSSLIEPVKRMVWWGRLAVSTPAIALAGLGLTSIWLPALADVIIAYGGHVAIFSFATDTYTMIDFKNVSLPARMTMSTMHITTNPLAAVYIVNPGAMTLYTSPNLLHRLLKRDTPRPTSDSYGTCHWSIWVAICARWSIAELNRGPARAVDRGVSRSQASLRAFLWSWTDDQWSAVIGGVLLGQKYCRKFMLMQLGFSTRKPVYDWAYHVIADILAAQEA